MKFQHIPPHHGFWPLLTWSYTIKALNHLRLLGSDWLFPGFLPILLKLIFLLSVKSICKVEAAHCGSSCFVCVKCAIKFFLFGLISPNLSMIFRYGGKWTKITSCAKRCGHFGCNFGWMNTSWIGWNIVRGILRQSLLVYQVVYRSARSARSDCFGVLVTLIVCRHFLPPALHQSHSKAVRVRYGRTCIIQRLIPSVFVSVSCALCVWTLDSYECFSILCTLGPSEIPVKVTHSRLCVHMYVCLRVTS